MSSIRKKAVDTTTPFVLVLISMAGAYYMMRASNKKRLLNVEDYEQSSGIRSQVPLTYRVDQGKLREWLEEGEKKPEKASDSTSLK